jgi:hypothetical protein
VAKRREDGGYEVRHRGLLQAIVDVGVLTCIICSETVPVVNEQKIDLSSMSLKVQRTTHDVFSLRVPRNPEKRGKD